MGLLPSKYITKSFLLLLVEQQAQHRAHGWEAEAAAEEAISDDRLTLVGRRPQAATRRQEAQDSHSSNNTPPLPSPIECPKIFVAKRRPSCLNTLHAPTVTGERVYNLLDGYLLLLCQTFTTVQ